MPSAVWKFEVPIEDSFELSLPKGSRILSLQVQRSVPHLWALCETDPNCPKEVRRFVYVGTGHAKPGDFWIAVRFVGTVQLSSGALVFHLFEKLL